MAVTPRRWPSSVPNAVQRPARPETATARTQGGHLEELRSATSLARLLLLRADEGQARAVLAAAFKHFPEPSSSIPDVEPARELLDDPHAVLAAG